MICFSLAVLSDGARRCPHALSEVGSCSPHAGWVPGRGGNSSIECTRLRHHQCGGPAAPAPAAPSSLVLWSPSRVLQDSGSGDHLVSKTDVPKTSRKFFQPLTVPSTLHTANGEIVADKSYTFECQPLGIKLSALVLDDTPNVASMGKLVMDDGFEFHWIPGFDPYYLLPDGSVMWLEVENNVHYSVHKRGDSHEATNHICPPCRYNGSSSKVVNRRLSAPAPAGGDCPPEIADAAQDAGVKVARRPKLNGTDCGRRL